MSTLYAVRDWEARYENAGSRKIVGPLDWFCCPTKHDGLSFRRLMKRKDGLALYGAWILITAVAAKCKPRGTLQTEDGPLTAEDIALKTGGDESVIKAALQVFSSKEVPWLAGSVLPASPDEVSLQDRTGQDIKEQDRPAGAGCAAASISKPAAPTFEASGFEFPTRGKQQVFSLPAAKLAEYRESFPGMDVDRQMRLALQWCRDNPARRKTAVGMPAFLSRWLSRACDADGGRGTGPPNSGPQRPSIDPSAFEEDQP